MGVANQDALNKVFADQLKMFTAAGKELAKGIDDLDSRIKALEKASGSSALAEAADKRAREVQVALGNMHKRVEALEKKAK